MTEMKHLWRRRTLAGGLAGLACWVLVSWLTQPSVFAIGGSMKFDFTFYYNSTRMIPEGLGIALCGLLWFAFGAEIAVASLPFADDGRTLLLRSLLHFAVMALTVSGWVFLNFFVPEDPQTFFLGIGDLWALLVSFTLVYALVWLGRWVGWYAEVGEIRATLGLAGRPSPLKWKETLPHMAFAGLLCLGLPMALWLYDAIAFVFPVLSPVYGLLLLPVAGFVSGVSLGRRQGFCPLYPLSCAGFILIFLLLTRLVSQIAEWYLFWFALLFPLLGNLAGWGMKRAKEKQRNEQMDRFG